MSNESETKSENPSAAPATEAPPAHHAEAAAKTRWHTWLPWVVFGLCLIITFALGMLVVSIMERRWETIQPQFVVVPVDTWETNNAIWGQNYPREYETFRKMRRSDTLTLFGGSYPRDYLTLDPRQVILFAGYAFSRDFKQARGHYYSVIDVEETLRTTREDGTDTGQPATCWTCKSSQVPKLMHDMGITAFYNQSFDHFRGVIDQSIGCLDCHDPATMNLRISRPGLRDAFARQGRDIDEASHQEMRSLVCAQCHVEYYFGNNPEDNRAGAPTFGGKGKYLVFPWDQGLGVDAVEAYFAERPDYYDWIHPVSRTRMIKMQHPDYEIFSTGIHAYRNVSCADCHMPYRTEGGVKFTNHHIQSPLADIAASCGVCHRWGEEEIRRRVEQIQTKVYDLKLDAEDAIVRAHFDVAACMEAGASEAELAPLRERLWRAQLRWDYVSASNGMGFHSAQECVRILGTAINIAQEARLDATRILARYGIHQAPRYPDISTRERAWQVLTAFEAAAQSPDVAAPGLLASAAQAPLPPAETVPPGMPEAQPEAAPLPPVQQAPTGDAELPAPAAVETVARASDDASAPEDNDDPGPSDLDLAAPAAPDAPPTE